MKLLALTLLSIIAILQYEVWYSKNGLRQYAALKQSIQLQKLQNIQLAQRNQLLLIETHNLKSGHEAIEERARHDLGMIKQGETFYQIIPS